VSIFKLVDSQNQVEAITASLKWREPISRLTVLPKADLAVMTPATGGYIASKLRVPLLACEAL